MSLIRFFEQVFGDRKVETPRKDKNKDKPKKDKTGSFERSLVKQARKEAISEYDKLIKNLTREIKVEKKQENPDEAKIESLVSLRDKYISNKLKVHEKPVDAINYLENRIASSNSKEPDRAKELQRKIAETELLLTPEDAINNNKRARYLEFLKNRKEKQETVIERLIKMKYLSRDSEVRERQIASLKPWLNYFKNSRVYEIRLVYLVIRTILKHDQYWLDTNPDGSWYSGERGEDLDLDFPIFNPDITPGILSKLNEFLSFLTFRGFGKQALQEQMETALPDFHPGNPMRKALEEGDVRKLIWLIREQIQLSRVEYHQVVGKVEEGWKDIFSFKDCKTEEERKVVAANLAKVTENSRGFCLKSPSTAYAYLSRGDVYVYEVEYLVDLNLEKNGKRKKDKEGNELSPDLRNVSIPEVGIHVFRNEDGSMTVNEKEIHGNAPNQGIRSEFLEIAREFVSQKNSDGSYKFTNAEDLEVKFADAKMFETVKAKIENLKNGGEDLNARELKFLYQVYRPVTSFELNSNTDNRMFEQLVKRERFFLDRANIYLSRLGKSYNDERDRSAASLEKQDYAKMFECQPDEVFISKNKNPIKLGDIEGGIKVVVGSIERTGVSRYRDVPPEEFIYNFPRSIEVVTGTLELEDVKNFGNLKELCGIILTEEDKAKMLEYNHLYFPEPEDPRLKKIFY